MNAMRTKLLIGGVVLIAAVTYLAVSGAREGWVYYLQVDEFVHAGTYQSQRVRLAGRVADEGVEANAGLMQARFDLLGGGSHVPVDYRGVIPELFKPGCEIVVEGQLGDDGVFHADTMLTKCASKYEEDHSQRLEAE